MWKIKEKVKNKNDADLIDAVILLVGIMDIGISDELFKKYANRNENIQEKLYVLFKHINKDKL